MSFPQTSHKMLNSEPKASLITRSHSAPFSDPPIGDFNSLSVWADNLVLELDRSLFESFSPSSESSLSPIKTEELKSQDSKSASRSPDSGIEYTTCNSPEVEYKAMNWTCNSPEIEFKALHSKYTTCNTSEVDCRALALNRKYTTCNTSEVDCRALNSKYTTCNTPEVDCRALNRKYTICNSPEVDCGVLNSNFMTCNAQEALNPPVGFRDDKTQGTQTFFRRNSCPGQTLDENGLIQNSPIQLEDVDALTFLETRQPWMDHPMFRSLPKPPKSIPLGRGSQDADDRRIDDVTLLMREMYPNPGRDAQTQTTPVSLSTSSSFTWVSECDWENRDPKSSSSDASCPDSPGSGCSSLYLSACSASSESFEEVFYEGHSNRAFDGFLQAEGGSCQPPNSHPLSISAPVLLRHTSSSESSPTEARSQPATPPHIQAPVRSHSAKELNELQAIDACSWLRAAGFPQYAQMYEDGEFPLDISLVQKDHDFLHLDTMQSLFRRLMTLNRCANIKFTEPVQRKSLYTEESEEEEYALSEHWAFERANRRWSRVITLGGDQQPPKPPQSRQFLSPDDGSHDGSHSPKRPDLSISFKVPSLSDSPGSSSGSLSFASEEDRQTRSLRRSGSDRVKEGARALIRRMQSLKENKKKAAAAAASPPRFLDARDDRKGSEDSNSSFGRSKSPKREPQATAPLVAFSDRFTEVAKDKSPTAVLAQKTIQLSAAYTELNQEDGDIVTLWPERRDSGVGSSLTRNLSCSQVPWHCFPYQSSSDVAPLAAGPLQVSALSAPQMLLLRKLSLLRVTTVMEKFTPNSRTGWSFSKLMARHKAPAYKDKVVFGVPLLINLQRTGQALPKSIASAMEFLRNNALDSSGIFRKSGVRSRIQTLKELNDQCPDEVSYSDQQAYDVADMLKQYFRELPEALMTKKLSETFVSIYMYVPADLRLASLQAALLLLPDENREVLHALLDLLYEICQHSESNQMTPTNVAVCFAPSLFAISSQPSSSSRRKTTTPSPSRELHENRAACECLADMIAHYDTLFTVSEEVISQSRLCCARFLQPVSLDEWSLFTCNGVAGWKGYVDNAIQLFLKEAKDKYKGWKSVSQSGHIDLACKKLSDGHPLRLWKVSTEVEAPPVELLNRIMRERHLWDVSFIESKVISRIKKQTEIYQYFTSAPPPNPPSDHVVLRSWRTDLPKGACTLIESSILHPLRPGVSGVRALTLASRYLIEPCGSGKSRITHISRLDTMGRSPEWYSQAYGKLCVLLFSKLKNSFSSDQAKGPETKV